MLILETPFWVAGAAESLKIGRIVIGASNKSGRRHVGSLAGSSRPLVPFDDDGGDDACRLMKSILSISSI